MGVAGCVGLHPSAHASLHPSDEGSHAGSREPSWLYYEMGTCLPLKGCTSYYRVSSEMKDHESLHQSDHVLPFIRVLMRAPGFALA